MKKKTAYILILLLATILASVNLTSSQPEEERTWIIYDNNYVGGGRGGAVYPGYQSAVLFTPPFTPCRITTVSFYIFDYPANFKVHVTDNLHNDLMPPYLVVAPYPTGWLNIDIQSYNITVTTDFFVTMEWLNQPDPQAIHFDPWIAWDDGPVHYSRFYFCYWLDYPNTPETWIWQLDSTEQMSVNYYIRAEVAKVRSSDRQYDWPMCGYDSACTSYSPSTAPNINRTAWIADLPGGTVWAYPLVAEGRAFIGAGGYLNAWNETDGSFLWRFAAPEQPGYPSTAVAAGGMVFFGTAEPGPGGCIYALNATTGEEIWSLATEGYLADSPAVVDDRLYFGGYLGSEQGKIYCINATTGSSIWNYTTQDRTSSVAVAYGKVYASCGHWETSTQAAVYCLDMYNGGLVWSFDTNRDIAGACAVANGKVYVTASYEGWDCAVFALNATDGNVVWSTTRYSNGQAGRGAVAYGKFFVILGYGASGVYALNETNGDEIWALLGPSAGGPVVADGKVFFARGDPANVFYAVNETTGAVVWSYEFGGWVHSATSAIAHGRVFVADHYEEKLYAFGLPVYNVNTGLDYATIQQAIDAPETLDGHTIRVAVGTYYEHVTVHKSLFLIGENRSTTIIDGRLTGTVVTVETSNVKITGFTIQNSAPSPDCGIHVDELSNGNKIVQNIIAKNGVGMLLDGSNNNDISENIIASNELGIRIYRSSDNSILHNNFIDNINQAYIDPTYPSTNTWDDSSLFAWRLEGNYWSNYDGKDEYHGTYQNETGGDWKGDTPYAIYENNRDNYPLMDKWWLGRAFDVNHDGVVNIIDISIAAKAFGSSYPDHPRWEYKADVNHDHVVNILDIAGIAKCYGKTDC